MSNLVPPFYDDGITLEKKLVQKSTRTQYIKASVVAARHLVRHVSY